MAKSDSVWERGNELNDELQSWYLPLYWMQQAEQEQAAYESRLAPFAQALVEAADTIRASVREILPHGTTGDLRMSDQPLTQMNASLEAAKDAAFRLGVSRGIDPFMTLSFMALPVIPTLRITTRGVIDVITQQYV